MALDQRARSHMSAEQSLVHAALCEWGAWAKTARARAWPSVSLLGRVIEQGPGAAHIGAGVESVPASVAVVEAAVCRLGAIDRRVAVQEYTTSEPAEVSARKLGLRVRQYRNVLQRVRWRISGYMDAAMHNQRAQA